MINRICGAAAESGRRVSRTDFRSDLRLCLGGEAEEGFVVFPVSQFTVF